MPIRLSVDRQTDSILPGLFVVIIEILLKKTLILDACYRCSYSSALHSFYFIRTMFFQLNLGKEIKITTVN